MRSMRSLWSRVSIHPWIVFAVVLAVYGYTMPISVVLEDDGEFVMAAYFAGVAHPPGYPLFVLLAHPFTWLPFGNVATQVHLASATFGAATCSVLWLLAYNLVSRISTAYVVAFALGFSKVFWSQAIIADVYTLNALMFFVVLLLCVRYIDTKNTTLLKFAAFSFGLGLSNHWPLFLLAAPALLLSLWPARRIVLLEQPTELLKLFGMLCLGLSPYLWMVVRSHSVPELSFYGALDTWHDFWFQVTRGGYSAVDRSPSAGWWDKLNFGLFLLREFIHQFTPVGAVIAAFGLFHQWGNWRISFCVGLLAAFLTGSLGLVLVLNFDYQFISRAIFQVYPLIPYGIMALWLGLGFDRLLSAVGSRRQEFQKALGVLAPCILAISLVVTNDRYNNRRGYSFAQDYGMTILMSFEPNATVFTHSDFENKVLGYLHHVEGVRPDITLLNDLGVTINPDGRLYDPLSVSVADKREMIREHVLKSTTPVYFFQNEPDTFSYEDFGLFKKALKFDGSASTFNIDDEFLSLLRRIKDDSSVDPWTVWTRQIAVGRLALALTAASYFHPQKDVRERYGVDLKLASEYYLGLLSRIVILERHSAEDPHQLLRRVEIAENLIDDTISKKYRADLYLVKGVILAKMGRTSEAKMVLRHSIDLYPHPENQARNVLLQLGTK